MLGSARERFAETARRRRIPLRNQDRIRMRPSMSENYCVSDLGTFVNDNVTFGEANRQKALNGKSSKIQVSE
jgi:hypothetical protein